MRRGSFTHYYSLCNAASDFPAHIFHPINPMFYALPHRKLFPILKFQSNLSVNPAFLLCLMYNITLTAASNQEWGHRVMPSHIIPHKRGIGIGITVFANMPAGIICSDINSQQTRTLTISLVGLIGINPRNVKMLMQCRLKCLNRHAS